MSVAAATVLGGLGVALLFSGAYLYRRQRRFLEAAQRASGTVVDAGAVVDGGRREGTATPEVTVRYDYEGETHESNYLHPGFVSTGLFEPRATELARGTDPGDEVSVFVNPDAPDKGFLVDSLARRPVGALVVGGGALLVAAVVVAVV